MVLDTRWKRFKYSNGNKTLCVLLALVMVAVIAFNSVSVFKAVRYFDDDVFKPHEEQFVDSFSCIRNLNSDIERIFYTVGYSAAEKEYYEAEAEYVKKALKAYRAEEEKNRLTDAELSEYIERLHKYGEIYDYDAEVYIENDQGIHNDEDYLEEYYQIYKAKEDGKWYQNDFDQGSLTTAKYYDSEHIDFGHTDETAESLLKAWFHQSEYSSYVPMYMDRTYYIDYLSELKNVKFYAKSDIEFTNVDENVEGFIKAVKSGEGNYLYCENGELHLSGLFKQNEEEIWAYPYMESSNVYVSVDDSFNGNDRYLLISNEYSEISSYSVIGGLTVIAIAFIALVVLGVMSVRLAGNTENGVKAAKFDSFPMDIHLALNGALVFAAVMGIAYIFIWLMENANRYFIYNDLNFAEIYIAARNPVRIALTALCYAIYLLILEFATSIARNIKAEKPIIKKTAIFLILAGIFKLMKLILKDGGKGLFKVLKFIIVEIIGRAFKLAFKLIRGIFKLIWKCVRKVLHLCKFIALKPKRLEKKLISATVLYALFNFALIGIIAIQIFKAYEYGWGEYWLFGFFWFIVLIALDTYSVYRATKYLKALDDIIDTSAKREPLPYDSATLPPSLKTLAESLEATNAELQEAVMRAVKDERTKAELITNVSHDLKTPLTSVINYIDLLQKCDIEDETAKQYMAVIEEKSARLKRLIEDLIEASKVSTGNVTLNKTKLNLSELASQAIVEETSDIEKNNLQIIFDEAPNKHIVFADGTKIYRVFENLLSNARKYSAPYTRIYASVYSDDNFGYFEIKNISKEALNISAEELTERFVRGDKSRSQEGNGLGLSIARELCKLNDGDLIITIDGDLFKATVKLPKEEI